jgi:hypothetical protein
MDASCVCHGVPTGNPTHTIAEKWGGDRKNNKTGKIIRKVKKKKSKRGGPYNRIFTRKKEKEKGERLKVGGSSTHTHTSINTRQKRERKKENRRTDG